MLKVFGSDPPSRAKLTPSRIVLLYALLGSVWILVSDRIVSIWVTDPDTMVWWQTAKGWLFVVVTAILLYMLVRWAMTQLRRSERELLESQRTLSTLMSNLPGMVYRCRNDRDWTMEFVSDGCRALTGCDPEDLITNRRIAFADLVHPEDRDRIWSEVQEALERREPFQLEYRLVTRSGEVRYVWEQGRGVYSEDGDLDALEGLIIDVTERRQLQKQLQRAQKMESVGQLAGSVAHDFNNMLVAIAGYSYLLLDSMDEDDPKREDVIGIKEATDQASALTRQLLTFSRQQESEPTVLDLNAAVAKAGAMLRHLLQEDIELVTELESDPSPVRIDPNQLHQVLVNLAVNARDAMPGGGRLSLNVGNVVLNEVADELVDLKPGPYVVLEVSDDGVGMDADTAERVFEPFFTTKEEGRGTGLGLSTVYGIIKQSDGHIEVESAPGEGTTFRIRLPRVGAAAPV